MCVLGVEGRLFSTGVQQERRFFTVSSPGPEGKYATEQSFLIKGDSTETYLETGSPYKG